MLKFIQSTITHFDKKERKQTDYKIHLWLYRNGEIQYGGTQGNLPIDAHLKEQPTYFICLRWIKPNFCCQCLASLLFQKYYVYSILGMEMMNNGKKY